MVPNIPATNQPRMALFSAVAFARPCKPDPLKDFLFIRSSLVAGYSNQGVLALYSPTEWSTLYRGVLTIPVNRSRISLLSDTTQSSHVGYQRTS